MMRNIPRHQYLLILGIVCILAAVLVYAVSYFACDDKKVSLEVIGKAKTVMQELESYRSEAILSQTMGNNASTITIDMEYAAPDGYHGMEASGSSWLEYIFINNKTYYRASFHPEWEPQPQFEMDDGTIRLVSVTVIDDFNLLNILDNPVLLNEEAIDDIDCRHYQESIRPMIKIDKSVKEFQNQLMEMDEPPEPEEIENAVNQYRALMEQMAQQEVNIEVWIGKEDYRVYQLHTTSRLPIAGADNESEWADKETTIKYYDFNKPIEIVPPENILP